MLPETSEQHQPRARANAMAAAPDDDGLADDNDVNEADAASQADDKDDFGDDMSDLSDTENIKVTEEEEEEGQETEDQQDSLGKSTSKTRGMPRKSKPNFAGFNGNI